MSDAINNFFAKTIRAFVEAVIFDIDPNYEIQTVDNAAIFILSVHKSMQPLYRFGLIVIAAIFYAYALIRTGKSFSRLDKAKRMRLMLQWLDGPFGFMRDFIRFFLTMTILFYYDSDKWLAGTGVNIKSHREIQCFYAGK